jgi:probable rRNA maturation factor
MFSIRVSFQSRLGSIGASLFRECAAVVLSGERKKRAEISYVIVNDAFIHAINKAYLRHDYPTDIITFPLGEGDAMEGEIYISAETARRNADEYHVALREEIARLAIHGVLHLCEYEDGTEQEKKRMRQKEDQYLKRVSLSGRKHHLT